MKTQRLASPPPAEALPTEIKQGSDIPADPQSQQNGSLLSRPGSTDPLTEAADAVPRWLAAARTRSGSETDSEVARKATFCGAVAGWNDVGQRTSLHPATELTDGTTSGPTCRATGNLERQQNQRGVPAPTLICSHPATRSESSRTETRVRAPSPHRATRAASIRKPFADPSGWVNASKKTAN